MRMLEESGVRCMVGLRVFDCMIGLKIHELVTPDPGSPRAWGSKHKLWSVSGACSWVRMHTLTEQHLHLHQSVEPAAFYEVVASDGKLGRHVMNVAGKDHHDKYHNSKMELHMTDRKFKTGFRGRGSGAIDLSLYLGEHKSETGGSQCKALLRSPANEASSTLHFYPV